MNRERVAARLIKLAKELISSGSPRQKKAYGIVRDPKKVINKMRDKGIALNYDGSIWTYPISGIGIPDYSKSPKSYAKNAESAVSKTGKISDSLKDKIDRYGDLLDTITRFKRMLRGMKVSPDTINDMKFFFKSDLEKFINNRVRDPKLKSLNSELETIRQKVEDGDFDGASKNAAIIQDVIDRELLDKWSGQLDFFQEQRKMMQEISRLLSRNPEAANEISTVGNPPDNKEPEAPAGPEMKLEGRSGEARLIKDLKRLVKLSGVAKFEYVKKDGRQRQVRVAPTDVKKTSKGWMLVGYDLDRKAERNFFVSNIV